MLLGSGFLPMFAVTGSPSVQITYLLRDEFTTDRTAGAVNGTAAEPGGGGNRVVTDAGSRLVISDGELRISGGGTYNDPVIRWDSRSKAVGLAIGFTVIQTEATAGLIADFGWDDNSLADLREHVFFIDGTGKIFARDGNRFSTTYNLQISTAFASQTLYNLAIIMLDTQIVWCARGGIYASWTMLHKATRAAGAPATLWPALNMYNRAGAVREVVAAVLPTWNDGDSVVAALSDGNTITGGASSALDAFFRYERRITLSDLQSDFSMAGSYVGVSKTSDDYYLYIDLGGGYEWRLLMEKLANHDINALTTSEAWGGGFLSKTLAATGSVWEYAYSYPGTTPAQIGNGHGNERQTSLRFWLDGVEITPAMKATGSQLVVIREAILDNGTTDIGTSTTTYTLTPSSGLTLEVAFCWYSAPGSTPNGLVGMWPFVEDFNRGYLVGLDVGWNLATNQAVDSLATSTVSTRGVLLWESGGDWAMCQLRNSAVATYIQDRQDLGKIYPSEAPTLQAGNIQTITPVNYRVKRMASMATYNDLIVLPTA
jgi:hypothetical protein